MAYYLTVSSGIGSIGRDPNLMGIGKKIPSVLTYGVNVVQVDLETFTSAELFEPNVEDLVKRFVEDLKIKWVMHGEIGQTVAYETALQQIWRQAHRRIHQYMDALYEKFVKPKDMQKYLPGYLNFHISNMMSIGYFAERFRYQGIITVDFKGRNDWTELFKENPELRDWFIDSDLIYIVHGHEVPIAGSIESIKERITQQMAMDNAIKAFEKNEALVQEIIQELARRSIPATREAIIRTLAERPEQQPSDKEVKEEFYKEWLDEGQRRLGMRGAITEEDLAYVIIAKYLELKKEDPKEPLWKLFFGDKALEEIEKGWGTKERPKKLINVPKGEIYLDPEIVAMVSCRYIMGHFEAEPLPEYIGEIFKKVPEREKDASFYRKSAIDKLKGIKLTLVFENPELSENQIEGLQRIIRGKHMYNLIKACEQVFKTENIRLLIDFNHWLHNAVDPGKEFEVLRKEAPDFGKYVKAAHIYEPLPIHWHNPFDIPSDQQFKIYRWLFQLREMGFKEGYLVFERGGGQNPFEVTRTAVLAIREIIKNLDKDIDPKKLPLEFYGISSEGILSPERQMVIIREHARDPLRGLIIAPEEEHTALGKEALAKPGMTPEKWKKEELR